MNFKKFALLAVVLLASAPMLSSYTLEKYYARYDVMEKGLENSLSYDKSTANAIKHATAASDMFHILRLPLGDALAENTVIKLGVMNEYIEQAIYPNDRDSVREIMKDLHNNYVGIEAAKLADSTGAFKIIQSLAANRTLIVNRDYNPFFEEQGPKQDVVAFGYSWFDAHRDEIDSRIQMKIKRSNILLLEKQISLSSLARRSADIE